MRTRCSFVSGAVVLLALVALSSAQAAVTPHRMLRGEEPAASSRKGAPEAMTFRAAAAQLSFTGAWNISARANQEAALAKMEGFLAQAAAAGADTFNVGEDFLYWNSESRAKALPFCEVIPDIVDGVPKITPCADPSFNLTSNLIIKSVSCMAQKYGLYVIINTAEVEWCEPGSTKPDGEVCPQDGRFQYNTDVAFGRGGNLLAKYRKSHLTAGSEVKAFNEPPPEVVFFTTEFGRMFLLTCYDIEFQDPAQAAVNQGITTLMYEVDWVNSPPIIDGIMLQQARSRMLGINLIAANNNGAPDVSGGGVFSNGHPIAPWFTPYIIASDKLVIADVPVTPMQDVHVTTALPRDSVPADSWRAEDPSTDSDAEAEAEAQAEAAGTTCAVSGLPLPCHGFTATPGTSGSATVVSNGFNCSARWSVSADSPADGARQYALMAIRSQITFGVPDPLFAQICAVAQCLDFPNCPIVWNSTALFDDVEVLAGTDSTVPLPMLGVGKGQVLPADAIDVDYAPGQFMHVATSPTFTAAKQPFYSLSVFGFSGHAITPPPEESL